ncbi:SAM-dependent methyltransferase [Nonomuraea insulae]|uniref:SAM-dependent methyltransferase n=1 Tax=Nonomuraea insulae TaxID=1616787 RepID=A0ABW1CR95_9ACTN
MRPHQDRTSVRLFLGGKDNYEADRKVAEEALKIAPDAREAGRANRAFLRRAVRHIGGEAGIRQFLDAGFGHDRGSHRPMSYSSLTSWAVYQTMTGSWGVLQPCTCSTRRTQRHRV